LNWHLLGRPWLWTPLVLVTDFITKRLVLANIETLQAKVDLLGSFVRLAYVRNNGAAMGLFPSTRGVLISVSSIAIILLVILYRRTAPELLVRRGALAAILGGALGNLVDRVFYGGLVVDFIDIGIGSTRFYTFNVADMGVTLGGVILFLSLLRDTRQAAPESHERPEF